MISVFRDTAYFKKKMTRHFEMSVATQFHLLEHRDPWQKSWLLVSQMSECCLKKLVSIGFASLQTELADSSTQQSNYTVWQTALS
jgi:hypothetical protein